MIALIWIVAGGIVFGKALAAAMIRPWEECSNCGWSTKEEDGTCAGCGGKRL